MISSEASPTICMQIFMQIMVCKFKSVSLFISLEIHSLHGQKHRKICIRMTKCRAGFATGDDVSVVKCFFYFSPLRQYYILKLNDFIIFNSPCFNTFYKHKPAILFPFLVPNPQRLTRAAEPISK